MFAVNNFAQISTDDNSDSQQLSATEFPYVELPFLKNDIGSLNMKQGKNLIAVFSPTDCGVCLSVLNFLNKSEAVNKDIRVIGIINTPYRQAARKFQRVYNLNFPLLYDSLGVVKKTLNVDIKPALVLVDSGIIQKKAIVGVREDIGKVNEILSLLNTTDEKNH